ncbi:MAG TPA: hypothetical protein VFS43_46725 [Polyangiaceae bacterium]|nr:hypothetical protein [Polyangiaceae bacterium]
MRNVELCACPTIGAFVERQVTYYCSTCGKAVPDPDDPTRPAMAGRFDGAHGGKVLRVVRVDEGPAPEAGPSLYGPCSQGCGRKAERSGYVTALGVFCECGGLFAGVQINPPPALDRADPLAGARQALAAPCPGPSGPPHVLGPLGTNGWRCSGCGLTLNEETLRALGVLVKRVEPKPPEPAKAEPPRPHAGPGWCACNSPRPEPHDPDDEGRPGLCRCGGLVRPASCWCHTPGVKPCPLPAVTDLRGGFPLLYAVKKITEHPAHVARLAARLVVLAGEGGGAP